MSALSERQLDLVGDPLRGHARGRVRVAGDGELDHRAASSAARSVASAGA
jgi:hypothetical protein